MWGQPQNRIRVFLAHEAVPCNDSQHTHLLLCTLNRWSEAVDMPFSFYGWSNKSGCTWDSLIIHSQLSFMKMLCSYIKGYQKYYVRRVFRFFFFADQLKCNITVSLLPPNIMIKSSVINESDNGDGSSFISTRHTNEMNISHCIACFGIIK